MSAKDRHAEVLEDYPSLPISGMRGSRKLRRLRRRAKWLEKRIAERSSIDERTGWDKQELSALNWAIQQIIDLEEDLDALEKGLPRPVRPVDSTERLVI
jgi:hypothetical protein